MNVILSSSIKSVSQKIRSGELQPSDLYRASTKLVESVKSLNAYIHITEQIGEEQSNESNERQAKGQLLGELDGIPIAIKDNFCVEDAPTTCASLMLANFVPGYNSTVYERLKKNGAVLIGKTNLDQFAMGSGTIDSFFGPTKNIWGSEVGKNFSCGNVNLSERGGNCQDDWYIAGGSSGGSAVAVASGTCFASLGSDTGGSTRNPASYCGLVGFKPSYGLVSRHGLIPLVNSMDVPGILTRSVDDCITVMNAVAGPDEFDSTTIDRKFNLIELPNLVNIRGLRIGIPKEYSPPELDKEVAEIWKKVSVLLEEAGAIITPVSLRHTEFSTACYSILNQCEVASNMARYDGLEYGLRVEENNSTEQLYAKNRSIGFNDVVRSRILTGNYFLLQENYEDYFVKAMKVRRLISQDFDEVWGENVDLLLTPTTLSDAPRYSAFVGEDNQTQCSIQDFCTQPANMAGIPAINVPISLSSRGLPLSLQLMAPFLHEKKLFKVAKWIEDAIKFPKLELKDTKLLE